MYITAATSLAELVADGYFAQASYDAASAPALQRVRSISASPRPDSGVALSLNTPRQSAIPATGTVIASLSPEGDWEWLHRDVLNAGAELAIPELSHRHLRLGQPVDSNRLAPDATPPLITPASPAILAAAARTLISNFPVLWMPLADGSHHLISVYSRNRAGLHATLWFAGTSMPPSPDMRRSMGALARCAHCQLATVDTGEFALRPTEDASSGRGLTAPEIACDYPLPPGGYLSIHTTDGTVSAFGVGEELIRCAPPTERSDALAPALNNESTISRSYRGQRQ